MGADFSQRRVRFIACALQALRQFALVGDLLFNPGKIGADAVHRRLRPIQGFVCGFAAAAAGFQFAFGFALFGNPLFKAGLLLRQGFAQALQLGIQRAEFQRLPLGVLDPALGLDRGVLFGLFRLPRQMLQLLADFLAQVVEAVQVFAGVADAGFGLLATLLVLGDAGGFFQVHAQVLGPGLDDLADHALLDDRIAARAKAGAQEQVGDVAPSAAGAVEVVIALGVAANRALDRDLVERTVLAGDGVVGVVEDQFDGRLRHRLARRTAGKDHIGQRIAAQAAGRALAHHPADRIDDVGLAAAVRTDHAGHVGGQVQGGRIDEGLETGQLDGGQAHAAFGFQQRQYRWVITYL